MEHRVRIQMAKEDAMCGADLPAELRSTHAEESVGFASILESLEDGGIWEGGSFEPTPLPTLTNELDDIQIKFQRLIDDFRPIVQDLLNDIATKDRHVDAMKSWRELKLWDKAFKCPTKDCDGLIGFDEFSNDRRQYRELKRQMKKAKEQFTLGTKSRLDQLDEVCTKIVQKEGSESMKRYQVDWMLFRQLVNEILKDEEGQEKQIDIKGKKVTGVIPPTINVKSSKPLDGKELHLLTKHHPLLSEIALRLKIVQRNILHCTECKTPQWKGDDLNVDDIVYFHRLSGKIIRAVIEVAVGNAVIRAPKSLQVLNQDGDLVKATFSSPGSKGRERRDREQILGEAILTAFEFETQLNFESAVDSKTTYSAIKEDQKNVEIFIALGTEIAERLAHEVKMVKPKVAFHLEANGKPDRDEWCKTRAVQLLYAVNSNADLFYIEKTREFRYTDGEVPNYEANLIRLTDRLHERIRKDFCVEVNGVTRNLLREYFHKERVDPMICPPIDRSNSLDDEGGFLTPGMQKRKPMISDKQGHLNSGTPRFNPSDEAVKVLNVLQKTTWSVDAETYDVVKTVFENEIKNNLVQKLVISEHAGDLVLGFKDGMSKVRHGQVREWMETFQFVDELFEHHAGMPVFWHPWYFDWRGRVYTVTNILSPQNDDVSRGLLRFADKQPINQSGLKWLGRKCASFLRGMAGVQSLSKGEQYDKLLKKLDAKTWECYDEVTDNPLFEELLREVLALPTLEGFAIWGEGDVFRSKAEGFQRYTTMLEYIRVLDAGGVGALSGLPLNLDASSSVYQHAAALLRDESMASVVNVAPQLEIEGPADIYLAVVGEVEALWKKKCPFESIELEPSLKNEIKRAVLKRSIAKTPVMIYGYGAGRKSIIRSFLTHNQAPDGDHGGWIKVNEALDLVEEDQEGDWLPTAHLESSLAILATNDVKSQLHEEIATHIAQGFLQAIQNILPSFGTVTSWLKKMVKKHDWLHETPLQWTLLDTSQVNHHVWMPAVAHAPKPWATTEKTRGSSTRLSIRKKSGERSLKEELSGVAPNFIHSLDALHMRRVVLGLSNSLKTNDFWSVHDSFGCHPNFVDDMVQTIRGKFVEIHELDNPEGGILWNMFDEIFVKELEYNALGRRMKIIKEQFPAVDKFDEVLATSETQHQIDWTLYRGIINDVLKNEKVAPKFEHHPDDTITVQSSEAIPTNGRIIAGEGALLKPMKKAQPEWTKVGIDDVVEANWVLVEGEITIQVFADSIDSTSSKPLTPKEKTLVKSHHETLAEISDRLKLLEGDIDASTLPTSAPQPGELNGANVRSKYFVN